MRSRITTKSRLNSLEDFPYKPKYSLVEGLRMYYVDEGPAESPPVLLLHGNPSWSYIYRNTIKRLKAEGIRVIAPDLIGFGRSDKPDNWKDLNVKEISSLLSIFIKSLDLRNISLYGQDWGAIFSLCLISLVGDRISGLIISNGALPLPDTKLPLLLKVWIKLCKYSPWLPIGAIVNLGCRRNLSRKERNAYKAPFSKRKSKIAVRHISSLLLDIDYAFWWKSLRNWKKPVLTVFGDSDPVTRGSEQLIINNIPGAKGENHRLINAGHFIQEDSGEQLADIIIDFHQRNTRVKL